MWNRHEADYPLIVHATLSLTCLALVLAGAAAGFARVFITDGSLTNSFAISTALFTIVITSVVTGTVLPFGLAMMGFDPANAGTTIQVRLVSGHKHVMCVLPGPYSHTSHSNSY